MDLKVFDTVEFCEEGAELELLHPGNAKPLGVFITLAGVDSRKHRQAIADITEKRVRLGARGVDEVLKEDVELAARCTIHWRNVELEGVKPPCTPENARDIYTRFPWIREQALAFVASRANFLRD